MKENLLKIVNHYGVNNQQRKLEEEVFELQEAIFQYNAQKEACEIVGCSKSHVSKCKEHIAEEIADVLNLVEQFMYYYDIDFNEQVLEIKHLKVIRQLERIKNNNKELRTDLNYYKCSSNRLFEENKRLKDKLNESEKARKEAFYLLKILHYSFPDYDNIHDKIEDIEKRLDIDKGE